MNSGRRRFVAWALSDFLLCLLLILLAGLQDEGKTGPGQPQEILTLSRDAARVEWRGKWTGTGGFNPEVLSGVKAIGLIVPPEAPAAEVVEFQMKLQQVVEEVLYARDR